MRRVPVEVAPGVEVVVLEAADAGRVLEAALDDPARDPYAAILWPTAVAVARALAPEIRPGMRLLDLGAGTGLSALAAARLGAVALAVDHDAAALGTIALAARLQGLEVGTLRFDLHAPLPLPPAEVVVLADLLYEPALARAAAGRALEALWRGSRVLVGDPGRSGRALFQEMLSERGARAPFAEVPVRLPGEASAMRVGVAWLEPI